MKIMSLLEQVEELSQKDFVSGTGTTIEFVYHTPQCRRLERAFGSIRELNERMKLLIQFLHRWNETLVNRTARTEMIDLLGADFEGDLGRRFMFTVTNNRHELSCWHGVPGPISANYVDSKGAGDIFKVTGNPLEVEHCADRLGEVFGLQEIETWTGTKIWLYFSK